MNKMKTIETLENIIRELSVDETWDIYFENDLMETKSYEDRFCNLKYSLLIPKDKDLILLAIDDIVKNPLKIGSLGVYKLLLMIDVYDNEKYKLFENLMSNMNNDESTKLLNKVINIINTISWKQVCEISHSRITLLDLDVCLDFIRRNEMIFQSFFSPIKILNPLIEYTENKTFDTVLNKINVTAFCLIVSHHLSRDLIVKQMGYLSSLIETNYKCYVFLLLFNRVGFHDNSSLKSLYEKIIVSEWNTFGIRFLRFVYKKKTSKNVFETQKKVLTEYIKLNVEKNDFGFLDRFKWHRDFNAFSQLCLDIINRSDSSNSLISKDPGFLKAYSKQLISLWNKCKYKDIVTKENYTYKLYDVLLPENQMTLSIIASSIFNSSEEEFIKWEKLLKKISLIVKPLFYSNHQVNKKASEISMFILNIIFKISEVDKFDFVVSERLALVLIQFQDFILYPFLSFIELDEDVWNYQRKYTHNYFYNNDIVLLNSSITNMIENADDSIFNVFKDFLNTWVQLSNTRWIWFDKFEERSALSKNKF